MRRSTAQDARMADKAARTSVPPASRTAKRPRERRRHSDEQSATTDSTTKKTTYVVRRQELEALASQLGMLEAQLDSLRGLAGLPTTEDHDVVKRVEAQNGDIRESLRTGDLYLGRVDSMLTNGLLAPPINPLSTYIHLPVDMEQRRTILRSVQDVKLRRGIEIASERLFHLDHSRPYLNEERFTTASGEYHYIRQEITQFRNFRTARQLYDTFVNFLANMEISVTEGLGQLTLREDSDDMIDPTIWNHRFLTVAEDVGCTEELNLLGFARFHNHLSTINSPTGIVVFDTVNVDDLYPYRPGERTCKDVQAAHMVYEMVDPRSNETVVVLKQWYDIVQLPPQFELAPEVLAQLQRNCSRWCTYIVKYLREYVVAADAG